MIERMAAAPVEMIYGRSRYAVKSATSIH